MVVRRWLRVSRPLGTMKKKFGALKHDAILIYTPGSRASAILVEGLAGKGESSLRPKMVQRVYIGEDAMKCIDTLDWGSSTSGWTDKSNAEIKAAADAIQKAKPIYNITNNNCQHFAGAIISRINNATKPNIDIDNKVVEMMMGDLGDAGDDLAFNWARFNEDSNAPDFEKLFNAANVVTADVILNSPDHQGLLNDWVVQQYAKDSEQDAPKEG